MTRAPILEVFVLRLIGVTGTARGRYATTACRYDIVHVAYYDASYRAQVIQRITVVDGETVHEQEVDPPESTQLTEVEMADPSATWRDGRSIRGAVTKNV